MHGAQKLELMMTWTLDHGFVLQKSIVNPWGEIELLGHEFFSYEEDTKMVKKRSRCCPIPYHQVNFVITWQNWNDQYLSLTKIGQLFACFCEL